MKKLHFLLNVVLLAGLLAVVSGCSFGATRSKDECLEEFFGNVQAGKYDSMYQQIHPDNSNYSSWKNGAFFQSIYDASISFDIISENGDTFTVFINDTAHTNNEIFIFEREDDDIFSYEGYWSIRSFTNNGTTYN